MSNIRWVRVIGLAVALEAVHLFDPAGGAAMRG